MRAWIFALLSAGALTASGPAMAAIAPSTPCEALARAAFPDPSTTIASASRRTSVEIPAFGPGAPTVVPAPEHCEVVGAMHKRQGANGQTYAVRFRVRLPTAWNGRLFFEGGGGSDGALGATLGSLMGAQPGNALERGYAVVSQDAGHDNAVNNDPKLQGVVTFGWDAEARRNYGGASIGPVAQASKALLSAYYGHGPEFTYFVGGSKGGQEGMMAVQRFPDDFDAVLIGYPGFRLAYAGAVEQMWDAQAFAEAARSMGLMSPESLPLTNKTLSDEDLLLVSKAVLQACDQLDGLADGMVENLGACTTAAVAPALQALTCPGAKTGDCLLPAQIAALRKVFAGARGPDGRPYYSDWLWDPGVGARTAQGVSQGWRQWKLGPYAAPQNLSLAVLLGGASASAVFTSPPTPVADNPVALARYTLGVDVAANDAKARVKWGAFNESAVDFMNAESVDLTRFTARGGKIIIYHGVADPVFSIKDTTAWYQAVDAREQGKADRFMRLYAVPGMNHGGGGPSTDQFDAFDALTAWREKGAAPAALVATARASAPWPGRTRLLCPYPSQPRYQGGDSERAESFHCTRP